MAAPIERSYNGWRAHRDRHAIGVVQIEVAGASFPNGVVGGDVQTVLAHVAEQFHRRVEPLVAGWCWGYNYRTNRNANNLSCHASGTAIDLNAPRHPNGRAGTFTAAQVREIRAILREVPVVRWGGDFRGTPDEMHFEINATAERVAQAAAQLRGSPLRPAPQTGDDDMTPEQDNMLRSVHAAIFGGGPDMPDNRRGIGTSLNLLQDVLWEGGGGTPVAQTVAQRLIRVENAVQSLLGRGGDVVSFWRDTDGKLFESSPTSGTYRAVSSDEVAARMSILDYYGVPYVDLTGSAPVTVPAAYGVEVS